MTESHQRFLDRYATLLPAEVTPTINRTRNIIAYRIAGPQVSVQFEIDRIGTVLARFGHENVKWTAAFTKPILWGDEFVSHGEVFVPEQAQHFWRMVAPGLIENARNGHEIHSAPSRR